MSDDKRDDVAGWTPQEIWTSGGLDPAEFARMTDRARRILQHATEEASRMGHHYIGTEHILLGILNDTESIASGVLVAMGVDLDRCRTAVEFIIGRGAKGK